MIVDGRINGYRVIKRYRIFPHFSIVEIIEMKFKASMLIFFFVFFNVVSEYLMSGSPRSYPARYLGVAATPTVTR